MTKQDIALPYKESKKPKKSGLKGFLKNLFKDSPKNKIVLITTYLGLLLAVVALVLSLIPLTNDFGLWIAVLAVALELFGIFKKDGKMPQKMLIISVVVLVVAIASVAIQNIYEQSLIDHKMYLQSGEATEEILKGDLKVSIGEWTNEGLEVTLENKNSENKGYNVLIEAKDENGSQIVNEMISVGGIAPGKKIDITIFARLTDAQKESMKNAKFDVVSVSQY